MAMLNISINDSMDFLPDREIGFDYATDMLSLVPGETIFRRFPHVEDRKGNPDVFGELIFTNLRVMWVHERNSRINLSIGYNVFVKMALVQTDVTADNEQIQIKTLFGDNRYEFLFYRKKVPGTSFDLFPKIFNAYDATRGFREVLIRKLLTFEDQLVLFEREKILNQYHTVWNLGKNEGKLGRFYFTNVRIVWVSNTNANFNISVPFVRIVRVGKRNSSFGEALSIQSSKHFGSMELGFKIDSVAFSTILNEVQNLTETYRKTPDLGVHIDASLLNEQTDDQKGQKKKSYFSESELLDTGYNENQNIRAIYREDGGDQEAQVKEIEFNPQLGVCFEKLPKEITSLDQLWKIMRF